MSETQDAVHLSQEPCQEKVLVFSDATPRRYGVFVNGELEVSLLSHGAFVFVKEPGKPLRRAHPNSIWERGSMVLANQGGRWVMTADPDEDVAVLDELLFKQDLVEMKILSKEACRCKSVEDARNHVRRAAFAVLLAVAAGAGAGTSFFAIRAGVHQLSNVADHLLRGH